MKPVQYLIKNWKLLTSMGDWEDHLDECNKRFGRLGNAGSPDHFPCLVGSDRSLEGGQLINVHHIIYREDAEKLFGTVTAEVCI